MYALFVALGVVAATLVSRAVPRDARIDPAVASALRLSALVGAVVGAYAFELPADVYGWAPDAPDGIARLGGRTVLGGLLGGWLTVELAKWRMGVTHSTGDGFAAPLAVAMAFGRLGCVFAGCCPGVPIADDSPLAIVSHALHREPRFPASYVEAVFHGTSALVLILAARRNLAPGRRFAGYVATYAALRFALEFVRDVPRPFGHLSYYQLLAIALFGLAMRHILRLPPAGSAPIATK